MRLKKLYFFLPILFIFLGCGTTNGNVSSNTTSASTASGTSGVVSDPYISDAVFFWDKNKNGTQEGNEAISTKSNEKGVFTFSVEVAVGEEIVMTTSNRGIHNGEAYTGQLKSIITAGAVVSPLTTLEYEYKDDSNALATMLSTLGITTDDIHKDPMASGGTIDPKLMKASIAADTYLKLENKAGITTLKDIKAIIDEAIGNDVDLDNIKATVSIANFMTKDGNLTNLKIFKNKTSEIAAAKEKVKPDSDGKPKKLSYNGTFSGVEAKPDFGTLKKLLVSFSATPTLSKESSISMDLNISTSDTVTWSVLKEPTKGTLKLVVSSDQKSVTFTPSEVGAFELKVDLSNSTSSSSRIITFGVAKVLALSMQNIKEEKTDAVSKNLGDIEGTAINLDESKSYLWLFSTTSNNEAALKTLLTSSNFKSVGYDSTKGLLVEYDSSASNIESDLSSLKANSGISTLSTATIGKIDNQSWVYSKTLTEAQITAIVEKDAYSAFTKKGFDSLNGVLVQYTPGSAAKEQLASIKLELNIDDVNSRVYFGQDSIGSFALYPDDNGAFNDGGANWHLESINMPEAWEYSTGSDDFLIGVCDGGFDNKHLDAVGRFAAILNSQKSDHGLGVAGAFAANSNNGIGISGINWTTQVIAGYMNSGNCIVDVIETVKDSKEVKLINNSWGQHLPSTFDPTNASIAQSRLKQLHYYSAHYRQVVKHYSEKLFLWAAGNGVGNGLSKTGFYGVDAKFDNGALQYKNEILNKLDNLIIVAAVDNDNKLTYYSEYGESVDIAAPTHFDSLALNNKIYKSFGGTSAATPVVTGVASLIFSINPNLSGAQVKQILVDSATTKITERQQTPYNKTGETLAHPIPYLNAQKALEMATATVSGKVHAVAKIESISTPTLKLDFSTFNSKYSIESIASNVKSSLTNSGYGSLNSASSDTNILTITLDPNKRFHEITSTLTLKYNPTGESSTIEHTELFSYSDVNITTLNSMTLDELSSTDLSVTMLNSDGSAKSVTTDANANAKIYLQEGNYRISSNKAGFLPSAKDITIQKESSQSIDIFLTGTSQSTLGTLSGIVSQEDGIGMPGATVRISGGALTQGYFASAVTNEIGYYKITQIDKIGNDGETPIVDFNLSVSLMSYEDILREEVIVLAGKELSENFTLIQEETIADSEFIFIDDLEGDVSDWNATGLWHQQNFSTTDINNTFVDANNTALSPDEKLRGSLPTAASGSEAFWCGSSDTGSYIGTAHATQSTLPDNTSSGGRSTVEIDANLTTPAFSIPANISATFSFATWWEIEGQDPSLDYDRMRVYVIQADGTTTEVKKLNPQIAPKIDPRKKKNFSTAGFNRAPIWSKEEINLSSYAGETIKVMFRFDTRDGLYNGFRGWIIDYVRVYNNKLFNK
ncbi:MAG: S8 family serine peptidase [Helicobacteraceae bacterium]|nr:S8 family serine peptidase [Helicobacteraceae bacterium]